MPTNKTSLPASLQWASILVILATLACNFAARPTKTPQEPTPTAKNTSTRQPTPTAIQTVQAQEGDLIQTQQAGIVQTLQAEFVDQCSPATTQAQAGATISLWKIDLWPEFDQPSMLVINQITLSSGLILPAELTFRIPARAGEPNAVAVQDASGSLANAAYTRTVQGDWAFIRLTAANPRIQVEYYDPGLEMNGTARHFASQWISDYVVDNLLISLQVPANASNMQTSPPLVGPVLSPDGKFYLCQNFGALQSSDTFSIVIDYDVVP